MIKYLKLPINWFRRQSKKKKLAIVLVILLISYLGWQAIAGDNDQSQYELEAASYNSITEVITQTGNVTTAGVVPVYSTTTGVVDEVFVQNGDIIEADQPLFSVKATATKQEEEAALAAYMSAKNQLETAEAQAYSLQAQMFAQWEEFKNVAESDRYENEERQPIDANRNVNEFQIPEKEWLAAEANYKKQQQVIQQARVNASAAWRAYQATQDSQVNSILPGEIRNLAITKGDSVAVFSASTASHTDPAMLVVDQSIAPVIKIPINENDILKLKEGQEATVEFEAIENQTFSAVVDRVDSIANPSQDVVSFDVYLRLVESSDLIRKGLTADVEIVVESRENVLTVSTSAIKPYQGGRAVRVLDENQEIEYIPVEVGIRGNGRTQILSGIEEGTQVITALTNDQVQTGAGGLF